MTLPSRAAVDLAVALRAYAVDVNDVRTELRDDESYRLAARLNDAAELIRELRDDESYRLAARLNDAAELIRVLARLVEGKSIHDAFGAPGDFGYDTPIGAALARYYGVIQ